MMNSFWWGHNKEQSKRIHWLSWDRRSMPKNVGGLGFKSISAFNYAMPGKQAWKFMTNPDSLITRLFKTRYFSRSDFLQSNIGHNPSYIWRSIWSAKFIVHDGHKWSIGSGHNISIWDQKWLVNGAVISKPPNLVEELHHLNVSDLFGDYDKHWNVNLVNSLFDTSVIDMVLSTPLFNSVNHDKIIWRYEKDEIFSVKSAY
ncbi:hypothetical protein TSUD_139430 [Trifolium subterraneum]|uniref:Reverse transcriptase zinc-binding domain-containing protein n=1 Tax=Trifolium subterraneum TaxID=3900 RepID=A0A2Z6P5Y8_TRISU|nr:hypothetical protein TSUD_139430 [Trifolium subterraneum]